MGDTAERTPATGRFGHQHGHPGRAIRVLRRRRSLTLTQLAERSGLSVPFLSQLENQRANPSAQSLRAIALALEVTVTDLHTAGRGLREVQVVRSGGRSVDSPDRQLAAGSHLDAVEVTRAAGEGAAMVAHRNDCLLVVVRGTVAVSTDSEEHTLTTGDSVICSGGVAFAWQAVRRSATVLTVRTIDAARVVTDAPSPRKRGS